MPSKERDPEPSQKSFHAKDLGLLPLVLSRAELSIRSEAQTEEPVVSSVPPEDSSSPDEPSNRRSTQRFPLSCPLRYQTVGRAGAQAQGSGLTVNVSSGGILFTTEHALDPGETVEVSITWPAQLDHRPALELVAVGEVVRCREGQAAVGILQYEFLHD